MAIASKRWWVLGLETILEVAAAWLMALIVRDSLRSTPGAHNGFWLAITFYIGSGTLLLQHHNGLETGLLLCLYAAIARYYQVHGNRNAGRNLVLGVFLGLLVLARVDAVFFVIVFAGSEWFMPGSFRQRLARFLQLSITSAAISAPWWSYNYFGFGSLMPISGAAQQSFGWTLDKIGSLVSGGIKALVPVIELSRFEGPWLCGGRLLLASVLFAALLRSLNAAKADKPDFGAIARIKRMGVCLAVALAALAIYYGYTSGATYFYGRYLAPLSLLGIFAIARTAARLTARFPRGVYALAAILTLQVPAMAALAWTGRGFLGNTNYSEQLALVSKRVPQADWVAAGQSGTLGIFAIEC